MAHKLIEERRAYQREYMRDTRKWRKENHYCGVCQKRDAYTLAGRRTCAECAEKRRKSYEKHRALNPDAVDRKNEAARGRRISRRERHLCTECGKPLADGYTFLTCESCRAKNRAKDKRLRREHGRLSKEAYRELGLCVRCGAPRMEGFTAWGGEEIKLCADCYAKTVAAAAIGRAAYEKKNGTTWGNFQYEYEMQIRHGSEDRANP